MGKIAKKIRRNKEMLEEYTDFYFDPMLPPEMEDDFLDNDDNLDNLQNYTYEEFLSQIPANPTVLSHLTEEDFKMAQKEFPYFGVDKNGELHFHSLPKINFQKQVLRKISESLY